MNPSIKSIPKRLALATVCWWAGLAMAAAPAVGQKLAQKQQVLWDKLESEIRDIDRNLDGVMGLAIEDLTTGQKIYLRAEPVSRCG